mmetsp:Transcript_29384/g.49787  ORF Transcript_29384/g.49787 Transcript_29384/m.49787 type:complete len:204 (+) Transcript_29384:3119-3730(+)
MRYQGGVRVDYLLERCGRCLEDGVEPGVPLAVHFELLRTFDPHRQIRLMALLHAVLQLPLSLTTQLLRLHAAASEEHLGMAVQISSSLLELLIEGCPVLIDFGFLSSAHSDAHGQDARRELLCQLSRRCLHVERTSFVQKFSDGHSVNGIMALILHKSSLLQSLPKALRNTIVFLSNTESVLCSLHLGCVLVVVLAGGANAGF